MWRAGLFYAILLVVPIPSTVIAGVKGRWWMGIAGYIGLGSLVVLVSEAFQNSLLHLMWMVGLPLLVLGSILVRPGHGGIDDSRTDRVSRHDRF